MKYSPRKGTDSDSFVSTHQETTANSNLSNYDFLLYWVNILFSFVSTHKRWRVEAIKDLQAEFSNDIR